MLTKALKSVREEAVASNKAIVKSFTNGVAHKTVIASPEGVLTILDGSAKENRAYLNQKLSFGGHANTEQVEVEFSERFARIGIFDKGGKGLAAWAIALIVIFSLLAVAAGAALVYFYRKKRTSTVPPQPE